jgi:CDP-glucose 4,6-dehydratase
MDNLTHEPAAALGSWRGRRVFVTGATGIVGSWLIKRLLARGARVVALIRDADPQSELYRSEDVRRVSVINGTLEDYATLVRAVTEHETDAVFHLGAQTIVGTAYRSPLQTFEANIRGTYNLLEACRVHRDIVRCIVVASSDKAYGEQRELPYREDLPLQGVYPYEVSKSCADLIAQSYHRTYGVPVAIVRCGNVFGGGDLNWSRIVPGTIRSLLRGEPPIVRSDGTFVRDYIYVEDVSEAYIAVAEGVARGSASGEAFNFSTESPVTVADLVRRIQVVMRRTDLEPLVLSEARGEIHDQMLSAAKARQKLGWQPLYDLDAGLRRTLAWYEAFLKDAGA